MGQGQGNGQSQPGGQGQNTGVTPGGNGNGQNIGPDPNRPKIASRISIVMAEAGTFANPDGSTVNGAVSWPKGKPFSIKGVVEAYNEGIGSWLPVDRAVKVTVQLNQTGTPYALWTGLAGATGDGSFDASCIIPGAAAGGMGYISIHAEGNNEMAECWLVEV
jgi:hypothetical protein